MGLLVTGAQVLVLSQRYPLATSLATSVPGLSGTTREDHPNLQSLRATPAPLCPPLPSSVKIIRRIPRASRDVAAKKLASLVEAVLSRNDHEAWDRLLRFAPRCLSAPKSGGKKRNLVSIVNDNVRAEVDPLADTTNSMGRSSKPLIQINC